MKKRFTTICLAAVLWLPALFSYGQNNLQSPAAFLGYQPGEEFTYQHRINDWFRQLANNSDMVVLENYGQTYEGRELFLVFITAEENVPALEEIRLNNLRSAGQAKGSISGKHLPIVWLSYNIHGNESVSSEAAMTVAWELASGSNPDALDWLKDVVVVLDPCENPDGRARYVNWYRQKTGAFANPMPQDWEHHEPWPGGRVNHYLFDLNRDWAWQTQQESRQRIAQFQRWMPHVHVDLHEMGYNSPYFFGPSAEPYHAAITDWQREFHQLSGETNARYFDEEGWLYFTNEVFDLLYPSYGDTWPTYNGSIGFTYEQGGSGFAGLGVITDIGDTLTLADRIAHHHAASIATIETTWTQRQRLLQEFKKYFETAQNNPAGEYKTWVVKNNPEDADVQALLALLDRQKITYALAGEQQVRGLSGYSYQRQQQEPVQIAANDILITAYQPQSSLLRVLMEPETFLADSMTYDLTAWALPYVYDVEAWALKDRLQPAGQYQSGFQENNIDPERPYAWFAEWNSFRDVKLLAQLLEKGVRVRFAEEPFTAAGKSFGRGSLVITAFDNRHLQERFDTLVVHTANQLQKTLYASETGLSQTGKDLGSSAVSFIHKPRVAIVAGNGTSPTAVGEIWYYFEEELQYPATMLHTEYLQRANLQEFDVVMLPSGNYENFREQLMEFARGGGKVIAIERAVNTFTSGGETLLAQKIKNNENGQQNQQPNMARFGDRRRDALTSSVEGSIFKVLLDETHPLAYGQDKQFFLMKRNSRAYPLLPTGGWNAGVLEEDSHVSGFAGHKLKQEMKNTMAIGHETPGRGHVIYFSDSPVIRAFWHSGKLLLGNAVFLAGQ